MSLKQGIGIFSLIGLLVGLLLDHLIGTKNLSVFYYSFIILFSLLYTLSYDGKYQIRLIGTSIITALLLSIPLFTLDVTKSADPGQHLLTFIIAFPIFCYIAHTFHYGFHHDNNWRIDYSTLFAGVWTTIPVFIVACIFESLTNGLIMLAAVIFKTVGNNYLWDLYFNNRHFNFISNILFFFIGLGIAQINIQLINGLRFLLLKMMQFLFPVLALISVLYLILYLVSVLTGGGSTVEPLTVLVPLNILGIVFFNACFQDGKTEESFPNLLINFLKIYRIILFILTLMMVYKIFQELTVEVNLFMALLSCLSYTFVYAVAACAPKDRETTWICRGNVGTAVFFIISMFFLNLPYAPLSFNINGSGLIYKLIDNLYR